MPGAVDDTVKTMPIPWWDDNWELEDVIGLGKAERVGVKRRLHNLQEMYCPKMRMVLETVAESFGLAKELLQGSGAVDIFNFSKEQSRCQ